jgi:hypothetical protein
VFRGELRECKANFSTMDHAGHSHELSPTISLLLTTLLKRNDGRMSGIVICPMDIPA